MQKQGSATTQTVLVREVPIELCQLLKLAGLVPSGGAAKQMIVEGKVTVNDALETRKGRKLHAGDRVGWQKHTLIVALG